MWQMNTAGMNTPELSRFMGRLRGTVQFGIHSQIEIRSLRSPEFRHCGDAAQFPSACLQIDFAFDKLPATRFHLPASVQKSIIEC
jgi:hypothetical protein